MQDLTTLFNLAAKAADAYDGSEASYHAATDAAIAYEAAGGDAAQVHALTDRAIDAGNRLYRGNSDESFLETLKAGGAQIFNHGTIFVRPEPDAGSIVRVNGETPYEKPRYEPRLQAVVKALQARGIYFDDLVIDTGRVGPQQMRRWPYSIITIPRLNAQIAVANQYGEASFVANPSIPFMNWALFRKDMAEQENTAFSSVRRIIHTDGWEDKILNGIFGELPVPGPKILVQAYGKAHRQKTHLLTEEMVVALAKLHREHHPEKQWPGTRSGSINKKDLLAVTGDPQWPEENWSALNARMAGQLYGFPRKTTLSQLLKENGCSYNLSEDLIIKMAKLWRERHPQKRWPTSHDGDIPQDIVIEATGDPHWQKESWFNINAMCTRNSRGLSLNMPLSEVLRKNKCAYELDRETLIKIIKLHRQYDSDRLWPSQRAGFVHQRALIEATGDPHWQKEKWKNLIEDVRHGRRGFDGTYTFASVMDEEKLNYDLTHDIIVKMLVLQKDRYGSFFQLQGFIDEDIVATATNDPLWQKETWGNIKQVVGAGGRGITEPCQIYSLYSKADPDWRRKFEAAKRNKRPMPYVA